MKTRDELEAEIRSLKENNESLMELIRSAPAAIIDLNPAGIVKSWNPAAEGIFGWTADEVVNRKNPIVPEAKSQEFEKHHSAASRGDSLIGHEVRRMRKDGQAIDVSISTATIKNDQGAVERIVGVILDISKRKAAEREILELNATLEDKVTQRTADLREAIKDLEAFSYSVSHDLRSPLRAIDGYSNIILEDFEDTLDDEAKHFLSLILKNTTRMSQLIDDLLAFSKTGRAPLQKKTTDLGQMASDIMDELREAHPERKLDFVVTPNLPEASVDQSMFRQVLVNLLSNAFKFTRHTEKARIEFGGDGQGNYWVKDNGAGFDMEHIEKLFGVFQRLHRESEFEGTGVGLAIVAKIVHRHGGEISATGAVDEGACFHLTLPQGIA